MYQRMFTVTVRLPASPAGGEKGFRRGMTPRRKRLIKSLLEVLFVAGYCFGMAYFVAVQAL